MMKFIKNKKISCNICNFKGPIKSSTYLNMIISHIILHLNIIQYHILISNTFYLLFLYLYILIDQFKFFISYFFYYFLNSFLLFKHFTTHLNISHYGVIYTVIINTI